MTTNNLDATDLREVPAGGWIAEDVMSQIWDISYIPLPFTDRAGGGSVSNQYTEWNVDRLRDPDMTNARVDGQDTIDENDTNTGGRLGNHCQISTKTVQISTRAQDVNTFGNTGSIAYQVMMRQRELRRDREAIAISMQGSVESDAEADIAGEAGSVFSFIKTNAQVGVGGAVAGFNPTTKLTTDVNPGTARPLTETMIRDACQDVYDLGGNPSVLMARTTVIRRISEYLFTASARVATVTADVGQERTPATAKGSINVFVTDFGVTLDLIPNRLMQPSSAGVSSAGIFDFEYLDMPLLTGFRVEPLAKTGLADKRQMLVDWTTRVRNEESQAAIHGIDETAPVTA
jgi:hypothetical protein